MHPPAKDGGLVYPTS